MAKLKVNEETGEIEQGFAIAEVENTLPIIVSETEVNEHYFNPQKIIDLISEKAGNPVFDTSTKKGRDECKSHAFKIIRCITPISEISKSKAADAKKIVNQDTSFRRITEDGIRKLAAIHRKPLTEWEELQAAIKAELDRIESERLAELKYLQDWDDAISFNELYDLRKEREAIESEKARITAEKAEAERIEAEVQRRLEAERMREEQRVKDEAERAEKERIRAEQIAASEAQQKEIAERENARQKSNFIQLSEAEVKKFNDSLQESQNEPVTVDELRQAAADCRERAAHADKASYANEDYRSAAAYELQAKQLEAKEKLEAQHSKNCDELNQSLNLTTELAAVIAESVDNQVLYEDYEEYVDLSTEKVVIDGQPSNDEIIDAVAFYFEVKQETAKSWLRNLGEI